MHSLLTRAKQLIDPRVDNVVLFVRVPITEFRVVNGTETTKTARGLKCIIRNQPPVENRSLGRPKRWTIFHAAVQPVCGAW